MSALSAYAQFELPETLVTADREFEKEDEEAVLDGFRTVIDRESLQDATQNSLAEVLGVKAGVPVSSFFGNSDLAVPQLRGFGENAQLRTLVTLDGLPVNRSDLSISPFSQFPVQSLEKVTVLRGGRTVRYGPDALAGVIALESRDEAPGETKGSLEVTFGSDQSYRQRLNYATDIEGWGVGVQLENFRSDGFRERSGQESTSASFSLKSPLADWGRNRLTVRASRSFVEDPGALSLAQFRNDSRSSQFFDQDFENETILLGNQVKLSLGQEWELTLNGQGSLSRREANVQAQRNMGDVFEGSGEVVASRKGEAWNIDAGVRGRWSTLDFERSQPVGSRTEVQVADLSRASFGGFVTTKWKPSESWTLSVGASWDRFLLGGEATSESDPANPRLNFSDSANDGEAAFELGVELNLTEKSKVWARYDRSLRYPVLDEIAFFQGFPSDVPFNADLQPEKGQGVEIGFSQKGEPGWSLQSTVFAQFLEDEIFFNGFSNLNENLSTTERFGVELQFGWDFDWGELGLFYNYTYARFGGGVDEGRRIPLVPEHSASGSFTWRLRENLNFTVEGSYLSERADGNNRGEIGQLISFRDIPGRVLWNASASWSPWEEVTFFGRVNNVFDKDFISSQFTGAIFPGAGRQFLFGGRYEF